MTHFMWRKYPVFDREDHPRDDELKEVKVTSTTSGKGYIYLGAEDGIVHMFNRMFVKKAFPAHSGPVFLMHQMKLTNILITAGKEDLNAPSMVKIWNMERVFEDENGQAIQPYSVRSIKAVPPKDALDPNAELTTFTVHENLTLMAFGFSDGSVVLYRGDISKETGNKIKSLESPREEITNLVFRPGAANYALLYVTTHTKVWSFHIEHKSEFSNKIDLEFGCEKKCAVLSDASQEHQLVIGANSKEGSAVYFYQPDSKGQCLAFEGEKRCVAWHKNYLITVSKEAQPRGSIRVIRETFKVQIYDMINKITIFDNVVVGVQDIICEWGSIYILGVDNIFIHLKEWDTQKKLELLFSKNQFDLAINLAKSQQYDKEGLTDIFRLYGDHLYKKQNFEDAVKQYIKTIGNLDPSYVIRKFLDAHRIHNLTAYLQELHKQKMATSEHTTLLLNCYTKLKNNDDLEEFINSASTETVDVAIAIKVCRQANYFSHALSLAKKTGQHEWYIKILLEDYKNYSEALVYVQELNVDTFKLVLAQYGKQLVDNLPEETTKMLKKFCEKNMTGTTIDSEVPSPSEFIKLYVMQPKYLVDFLEFANSKVNHLLLAPVIYDTLFELYLQEFANLKKITQRTPADEAALKEVVRKAMSLIRDSHAPYDLDHAMVLCELHNFREGILYLYEKAQLYKQIVKYHKDHKEFDKVIEMCKAHGDKDPSLWRDALKFFGGHEERRNDLMYVLQVIEERELIPPLLVVQTLAQNGNVKVSVLKDYLIRKFQQEQSLIEKDEKEIDGLKKDIAMCKQRINAMKNEPQQFPYSIKCLYCKNDLYNPSIHFYCHHSYHYDCLVSLSTWEPGKSECPGCMEDNSIKSLNKRWEAMGSKSPHLQEQFHQQLSKAPSDGFSVVADYLSHGVFDSEPSMNPPK